MENLETKDVLKQIESTFKEMTKGFALDAEIKAEIASLKDEYKAIKEDTTTPDALAKLESIMQEQGMVLTSLKAAKPTSEAATTIAEQAKDMFIANPEQYKSFVEKRAPFIMEFKAAATMTTSNIIGSTTLLPTPTMLAGYNPQRRVPATFIDEVQVGKTSSARISYVDQVNADGTAATTTEGSAKPPIDVDFDVSVSSAVKVAASTKISDEMLDDVDFVSQAIQDELLSRVKIAASANIYAYIVANAGLNEVAGFTDYFTLARQATIFDVLTAAKATVNAAGHNANTAFVSHFTYAYLWMQKSSVGEYTQPLLTTPNELFFNGMRIVPTNALGGLSTANDKYVVCDINKLNVLMYKDLVVEAGWDSDDFTKNMRTFRGECRLHYFIKKNDFKAFLYGDLSASTLEMTAVA